MKKHFKDQQLSVTFTDIISSKYNQNRSGFSGTPYFSLPIDYSNVKYMKKFVKFEIKSFIKFDNVKTVPIRRKKLIFDKFLIF